MLLLAAAAMLLVVAGMRAEATIHELRKMLNDSTFELAYDIHENAIALETEAREALPDDFSLEKKGKMAEKIEQLKQRLRELERQLAAYGHTALMVPGGDGMLESLPETIIFLESVRADLIAGGHAAPYDIVQRIAAAHERIHNINHSVRAARRAHINSLSDRVARAQAERSVLLVVLLPCGLLLLASMLCNARCYLRKQEQAVTAEYYSALFAAALQSASVGVMIRDLRAPDHHLVFVNRAFTVMTGYDQVAMGGQKTEALFGWHTDPEAIAAFREAVARGEAKSLELLIYRKDGSSFWSEWHISPVKDERGSPTHYVSIITDITAIKQSQEELSLAREQAERASAVKSSFLATMSHELRTPLNGLLGVLQLLHDTPLNGNQRDLFEVAMNSGHSLHEIINDILDYAKIDAGKVNIVAEPFSMKDMVQDCIDLIRPVAASKNLDLRLEIQPDMPDRFISDSSRIRQILLNLITNAVKYTEQGFIKVKVHHLLSQTGADKATALIRFEVVDTGIGISAADQDRLFEEFSRVENSYSRRYNGTGLGLAISKRLVKLMNGEIGVESKPGQGSKFWFMLPLPIDPATATGEVNPVNTETNTRLQPPKPRQPKPQQPKPQRILLVEDSATNRLVASRFLEKAGYSYDAAVSGDEAINIAKARSYDLILMDISMPGMDGIETARRIRGLGGWAAGVPIIALTAHVMQGDRGKFLASGMNDHLPKPIDYEVMARTLDAWLSPARQNGNGPDSRQTGGSVQDGAAPELDEAVLQRLVETLGTGAMLRITDVFLKELPARLGDFDVNGFQDSLEKIGHTAHTLKSSSANCGLAEFSRLMAEIESAAAKKDTERVEVLLHKVQLASESARTALEKARRAYGAD